VSNRPTSLRIPSGLDHLRESSEGRAWLDRLPGIVAACVDHWELRIDEPFDRSYVSLVLPATASGGEPVVVKIQYPHRESDTEADALELWNGDGAVRLVDRNDEHRALLLEHCQPGRYLSTAGPETGLDVLIGLLPRLWLPAGAPFTSLTEEVARWIDNLPAEYEEAAAPFERSLLDDVVDTLRTLAESQGEQVLLHQDLHGDNVLSALREPWLAIDPKPLVGEREFGLSPIIRSAEFGHSKECVLHRLDRLTRELDLDRDRARLWAACQAVAWGFENGEVLPGHIETARWLLAA
jgi:streptomycin 6-kinase